MSAVLLCLHYFCTSGVIRCQLLEGQTEDASQQLEFLNTIKAINSKQQAKHGEVFRNGRYLNFRGNYLLKSYIEQQVYRLKKKLPVKY